MDLLDFPPEIFKRVIHCLVSDAGVGESWKLRTVCRTFDQEISENVLAVQSAAAFLNSPDLRVLKNKENLKHYLAYHVKTPRDVLPELPAKIQKMVEYATKILGDTNNLHDRNILLEVCAVVARTCRDPFTFLWRYNHASVRWRDFPSHYQEKRYKHWREGLSRDITIHDQLMAAISVGAHDKVAELLPHVPASLPLGAFGAPMLACVLQDDQDVITLMMKYLDQHESRRFKRDQVIKHNSPYSMLDAMRPAIMDGRLDMVNLLLSYLCRYLTPYDNIHFPGWIHRAVLSQHIEILKALLQVAPGTKPLRVNSVIFEQGLKIGNPAIVSTLIKYGSMKLDSRSSQLSALSVCIRVGSVAVIHAVAEAGADIDFVMDRHRLKNRGAITPLEYAIHFKKYDAVVCLIECGAKVPPISTWPTSKKMRDVIQNAVTKQNTTTK
ncbi:hypothetical protein J4E91_004516 [Alternaria rosae]|nr:hypothetical protein J4E91_004516 [Alternaria rosae]